MKFQFLKFQIPKSMGIEDYFLKTAVTLSEAEGHYSSAKKTLCPFA
jgi:hypothetical protein